MRIAAITSINHLRLHTAASAMEAQNTAHSYSMFSALLRKVGEVLLEMGIEEFLQWDSV